MIDLSFPSFLPKETLELVKQQLLLLLHSHACLKKDKTNKDCDEAGQPHAHPLCLLDHCDTFKELIGHMGQCRLGPLCGTHLCPSSKIIMRHWNECRDRNCVICTPIHDLQNRNAPN